MEPAAYQPRRALLVALPSDREGERVRFCRPPDLSGFELMVVEGSNRLWTLFHESYDICLPPARANLPDLSNEWWYRGRRQSCPLDALMVVEPGEIHVTRRVSGPANFWVARFSCELVERYATDLGLPSRPHLRICQTTSPSAIGVFQRFFTTLRRGAPRLEQESLLAGCLRSLVTTCGEGPHVAGNQGSTPPAPLRRARDYLHTHHAEAVSLEDLALVAGLDRFQLVRAFKGAFGLPPHRYQIQLRIAAAREQLRDGVRPALVEVGFADQSHLGRHFNAALGTTPAAYARGDALPTV